MNPDRKKQLDGFFAQYAERMNAALEVPPREDIEMTASAFARSVSSRPPRRGQESCLGIALDRELKIFLHLVDPPPGIAFAIQRGRGDLHERTIAAGDEVVLSVLEPGWTR